MKTNEKKERKYSSLKVILPIVIVLVLLFSSFAVYQVIRTRAGKDEKVVALIPYRKGDKWGFCNRDRKMVIPTVYDSVYLFSEGLAPVHLNSKCGYIDTKGNMVIPAVYDDGGLFTDGLAFVVLDGKCGFVDTKDTRYWED